MVKKIRGKDGKILKADRLTGRAGTTKAEDVKDLGDLIGDEVDDEKLQLGSDSEEDLGDDEDAESDEDDDGDKESQGAVGAEPVDDDAADATAESRMLALAQRTEVGDLAELKQRIHDDAAMLSNWRKSKALGHGRTREEVFKTLTRNCSVYFGYAEELAEYFLQMFSAEQAIKFFESNDQHRPLTIRTNSLKTRRSSLIQSLSARRANVDPVGNWTKVGLKVYDSQVPIGATPEYLGGHYMIQSASSFIPVMALAPQMNEVVLDMAAAPGGKTTYIGQLMNNSGTLFSNDLKKERCKSLVANVHRMGLTNVVVTNLDGKKLKGMLPRLDRVLLDAPCSGSGIISRDPSIKVKRGAKEFEDISRLQKELLAVAIDLVDANSKTGGYIVYSTCSVSIEENEAVVEHALQTRNVELVSFTSSVNFGVEGFTKYRERRFSSSMNLCRRYYPHVHNMDGFFVAKFKKTSNDVPERVKKNRLQGNEHLKVWGEEHWTNDMMETVMDFDEEKADDRGAAVPGKKKPMNKMDRKKLKRVEQLRLKAVAKANEARNEPEEEPKPSVKGKKKLLRKRKAEVEEPAAAAAAAAPAAESAPRLKKKKILKKKKAAVTEAAPPAAAAAAPAAEVGVKRKLKKRRKE